MRLAVVFGLNQVVSHGFGMFLFAALVPMMRDTTGLNYWHLALAGSLTQIAYLAGALFLSFLGSRLATRKVVLFCGALSTVLLFIMPLLREPLVIIATLVCLAASASISWGSIVEIITHAAPAGQRATYLSSASSGTAWGYGISGLILLLILPSWGWEMSWRVTAVAGALVLFVTWWVLRSLPVAADHLTDIDSASLSFAALFKTVFTQRTAFLASAICFLVGFTTMPFSTWLNTYLEALGAPSEVGGYSWSTVGICGMLAGIFVGKLADRRGPSLALLIIFAAFLAGQIAFVISPVEMVMFASIGYGMMYFPMWGVVAGWVSQTYSSKATMQISCIGMVTFGIGAALGNLILGVIRDVTGDLSQGFMLLAIVAAVLFALGVYIRLAERPIMMVPMNPI